MDGRRREAARCAIMSMLSGDTEALKSETFAAWHKLLVELKLESTSRIYRPVHPWLSLAAGSLRKAKAFATQVAGNKE